MVRDPVHDACRGGAAGAAALSLAWWLQTASAAASGPALPSPEAWQGAFCLSFSIWWGKDSSCCLPSRGHDSGGLPPRLVLSREARLSKQASALTPNTACV